MQLLTFTNLYPSEERPRHGIFVEERLRKLVETGKLRAQVLALRPKLPIFRTRGGSFSQGKTVRHGIPVGYLHVPTLPHMTNWIDPWLWARAAESVVDVLLHGDFKDVVLDAHFLYPDGVAAVILGRRLGLPTVITARGSDINVKCANPVMRRWMRWAAEKCAAVITVSHALANAMSGYGIYAPLVEVLPNGVDLEKFKPLDRETCRSHFGLSARVLLSVGHLVTEKGHDVAIEALGDLPDTNLVIVGDGPRRGRLLELARRRGVADRVRFLGLLPHDEMPRIYSAADALVLPTMREGMPNVLLESLACGTRVVATNVGGIGEIVTSPVAGQLLLERTPSALSATLLRLFDQEFSAERIRAFAQRFAWQPVVDRQLALYRKVLASSTGVPLRQAEFGTTR